MSESGTQERPGITREQPAVTAKLPIAPGPPLGAPPGESLLEWLLSPLQALRAHAALIAVAAAVGVIAALVLTGSLSNLFSRRHSTNGPPPGIVVVGSSWVTGQASLADSPQFQAIENRAVPLAQTRWSDRLLLLAQIAAAKKAAAAKARADLLRKFELERQRALAAYRAKLAAIQRLRAEQLAKQRAARARYLAALRAYLRARTVKPGQECQDPAVRRYFSCSSGLLPAKGH